MSIPTDEEYEEQDDITCGDPHEWFDLAPAAKAILATVRHLLTPREAEACEFIVAVAAEEDVDAIDEYLQQADTEGHDEQTDRLLLVKRLVNQFPAEIGQAQLSEVMEESRLAICN